MAFLLLFLMVGWAAAQAQRGNTTKQKVTTIQNKGGRSKSVREITITRTAAASSHQDAKSSTAPSTTTRPRAAVSSRANGRGVRPNVLPGYPMATIASQNFGSVMVGESAAITLTYTFPNGVTQLNGNIANGLDFSGAQSVCTSTGCSATFTFTPRYPGVAKDALIISDQNGNQIYETLLYGIGLAPQLGFDLGDLSVYNGFTNQPDSIAIGPDGNLYLADDSQNKIYKFGPNFSSSETLNIAELGVPGGIAVDGDNTVYIADKTNNRIVAYNEANGAQTTVTTTQLSSPNGVAVDGAGNLYIADTGNNRIIEIDTQGNETTVASGLSSPNSIAVDGSGDVFYADASNGGEVTKLPSDGSSVSLGTQLGTLYDIAVDAAGRVYISTSAGDTLLGPDGSIAEYGGGSNYGMAVDLAGDIFTTQPGGGSVAITNRASSNFILTTQVDTTTTGGDTVSNTGNTALTLSNLAISGTVFTSDSSSQCVNGSVVQPGSTCGFVVDFTPTAAQSYQESYTVTSNSLNTDATNDVDTLYGNGTGIPTASALSVSDNPVITGQPVTFTATVTRTQGSELPTPTGMVNFLDGTTVLGNGMLPEGGDTAQFSTSSLAAGNHTITAMYAGDTYNASSTSAAQNLLVTAGNMSSTLLVSTPASPAAGQNVTFLVGVSGTTQTTAATGTVTLTNAGATLATITLDGTGQGSFSTTRLAPGSYNVTGNYSGDATYSPSTSGVDSFTVAPPLTTTTTLSVSSGGSPVTSVASGSVVTLTAAVVVGTAPVSPGQVAFCDASAETCTDIHLLGTAQITSAGTAALSFVPGIGSHSYRAIFLGTISDAGSSSSATALAVTGVRPTSTTIAQSGAAGNYTLTGTVVGLGSRTLSPTGSVSFNDTTASPATVLGSAALGAATLAFAEVPAAGSPLTTGSAPEAVATGDFNGDGYMDLAIANTGGQTVGIFLGNGDGTFKAQVTYATTFGADTIGSADLNGDGYLDLVVVSNESNQVGVLLGNGDGTFKAQVTYSAGNYTASLALMDLNHDGTADIVVVDNHDNTVSVLLGNGDGTFDAAVNYAVGGGPTAVAEGDFNGDGNIDLAVANDDDGTVSILLGKGDGTFQAQVTYAAGGGPYGVQVGDFNGDGIADLVVCNLSDSTVSVLLGNGDGTFQPQVTYAVGSFPVKPLVADLNGDGNPDIALVNSGPGGTDGTVGVLLGNGNGTFQTQLTYSTGETPLGLAVADFNGDGYPDFATANLFDSTATILLSEVTQTATAMLTGVNPVGAGTHTVDASYPGDTNYGSSVSATTGLTGTSGSTNTSTQTSLTIAPATTIVGQQVTFSVTVAGTGQTIPSGTVTLTNTSASPAAVLGTITLGTTGSGSYSTAALPSGLYTVTATYNGDTSNAMSTSSPASLEVVPYSATVTTLSLPASTAAYGQPITMTANVAIPGGTVSGVGQVAFCDAAATLCNALVNLGIAHVVNDGSAVFKLPGSTIGQHQYVAKFLGTPVYLGSTSSAQAITITGTDQTMTTIAQSGTAGNYTLTGTVVGLGSRTLSPTGSVSFNDTTASPATVLGTAALGTATLGFTTAQPSGSPFAAGKSPYAVASGDFNGDGFADLAVTGTGFNSGFVNILLGNGDGTFQAPASYGVPYDPEVIKVADFNGDGIPDVAVLSQTANTTVSVLLGNGDGTFQAQVTYSLGDTVLSANDLGLMDINHDGIPDIVVLSTSSLDVLLGKGDGTFQAATNISTGNDSATERLTEADFNGDGNVDIAVADYKSGMVGIFLGNGDGTFGAEVTYPVGGRPNGLQAGDFNGDGFEDLAVTNQRDGTVGILLGNGDGTFQAQVPYPSSSNQASLEVADLNGDGYLDIAVTDGSGSGVSVFLGNGDGTFQGQQTYAAGNAPFGLAVGDFNGDGYPDLAAANQTSMSNENGTVTILLSEATQTATATLTGVNPVGSGTHTVVASYPGDTNFGSSVSAATGLTGTAGTLTTPTITWAPPLGILYGTALSGTQLDAVATGTGGVTVNGTYVYSPAAGTVLGVGEHALSVSFTPTDAGYGPATGNNSITVMQFTPYLTWPTPAPITTATPLSATQLDAVANDINGVSVPGTYDYTPEAGTLLTAGTHQITVTFTPTDIVDYLGPVTTTRSINVTQATAVTTMTSLTLSASTAAYEKAITLTATVATSSGAGVGVGQVAFCDATAAACDPLMNLGVAQLNSDAPAVFHLPGATIGQHQYVAKFLGTASYLTSTSGAQTLAVTGTYPTSTAISFTGSAGNYNLTGTVVGLGTNAVSPTGAVSFLDASNANASLGPVALGAGTLGFNESPSATSPYTVGRGPYGQATGDFNGDGFLDLVVQNYYAGTISVLLGNGDGTFQPQVTYTVGTEPERVLVADLNGDGKLDLIVANSGSGTIGVLLGNGDGSFQAQVTYPGGGTPVGLGVMDINHDGYPDVVAGDYYQNTMSVLLGNGDGTLKAAVTYPAGGTPQTLAEGDFNGDGNVDVVVGNFGGASVGIFLGNGDGTFQTMVTYAVGKEPQGVQVGDFNGDGKQDLAVSNSADATVGVLLGNGDGTFQPQVTYPVGNGPVGVVIADFNGDGFEDISVGSTADNTQSVLLGNGDGTFKSQLIFPTGIDAYGDTTGDFNGDGLPDISVSNFSDGTVTIFLSQVTETATATKSVTISGSSSASHSVAASYSGDTNFSASISQPTALTGGGTTTAAASMVTLTVTPAAPTSGQNVTFSVSVSGTTQTTPVPTGTVTLMNAGTTGPAVLGTITLGATGSGVYSTATLAAGSYVVTAVYGGDSNYSASSSVPASFTVMGATTSGPTLTGISPTGGVTGSPATTITLTGTNFVTSDQVLFGSTMLTTTFVNATTLTAVVPATYFGSPATYPVSVIDTAGKFTSGAANFVVSVSPVVVFTGPSAATSDQQPMVTFQLVQPYAVPINCLLTLTFVPSTAAGIVDPAVQFSSGGTAINVTIPAGSTATPPVQFQTGTVAGTATVTLTITDANGDPLTPPSIAPVVVTLPATVPQITSTAAARTADVFTVTMQGFSNTREVKTAIFHFTPMPGATLTNPDITVDVSGVFSQWFGSDAATQYGSTFTYTQPFNLNADPATIQSVTVTLVNTIGNSTVESAQ